MSFSDYFENKVLDWAFGATIYTPSSTLYIALSTGIPTDDAGGGFLEPAGNAYARVSMTNNKTNWTTAANGALENATSITFPTATGNWGTVTHFGIYDASTVGNILGSGALTLSKTITSGDTASFSSGALDITLD
jgi:hypothetical protein